MLTEINLGEFEQTGHIDASGNLNYNTVFAHSDYVDIGNAQYIRFNCCVDNNSTCGIAFYNADHVMVTDGFIPLAYDAGTVFDVDVPAGATCFRETSLPRLGLTPYAKVFNQNLLQKTYTYIVSKDGKNDFTTITDAVNAIETEGSIFIRNGVYDDEHIEAWGKIVDLIGESKNGVIIENDDNTYEEPPLEFSQGSIQNLTIKALDGTPSGATGWNAYAIHLDKEYMAESDVLIKNCYISSYRNAAIGCGLWKDGSVRIENCELYSNTSYPLFFHDNNNINIGDMSISLIDSILTTDSATSICLRVDQEDADNTVTVEFVRNTLKGLTNPTATTISANSLGSTYGNIGWENLYHFTLSPSSYGNNLSELNYNNTGLTLTPNDSVFASFDYTVKEINGTYFIHAFGTLADITSIAWNTVIFSTNKVIPHLHRGIFVVNESIFPFVQSKNTTPVYPQVNASVKSGGSFDCSYFADYK